eukprot:TRINITY_DN15999_c0_g1_i1.p1 TRINITY_DN15999_c0_g1~~TRINITY_DN15999_c0_g1_i1.p1  ORF type:complete len:342 (-),score=76.03 TRINITY_DN15999_c0_g1_i1:89-1114(-)
MCIRDRYHEDMLECCKPLEEIKTGGIVFEQWLCLARCNGAKVDAKYATESSVDEFREVVRRVCRCQSEVLIVSYSRKTMNQSGDGHYSPIGGYNAARDMVLIMDVARFKHPPHWVPLETMFESMLMVDPSIQKERGFVVMCSGQCATNIGFSLSSVKGAYGKMRVYFATQVSSLLDGLEDPAGQLAWTICFNMPSEVAGFVSCFDDLKSKGNVVECLFGEEPDDLEKELRQDSEHVANTVMQQVQSLPLYKNIEAVCKPSAPLPVAVENAAVLILGADHLGLLPVAVKEVLGELLSAEVEEPFLSQLMLLKLQLSEMQTLAGPACCKDEEPVSLFILPQDQ